MYLMYYVTKVADIRRNKNYIAFVVVSLIELNYWNIAQLFFKVFA